MIPEYSAAALVALAAGLAVAGLRGVLRSPPAWAGLVSFGIATLLADLALTGIPIVTYGEATRSGIALGPMPVEDLLYGLALYLVALAAWGPEPAT